MKKGYSRYIAAKLIRDILSHQGSLTSVVIPEKVQPKDRPLIQAMCYGVMRHYFSLQFLTKQLLTKPLKPKDNDVYALILLGLYQLIDMRIPEHAATFETVAASIYFKKTWAKGLINAVLQRFLREKETLLELAQKDLEANKEHSEWMIQKIQKAWPEHAETIFKANTELPAMSLRVNHEKNTTKNYLDQLSDKDIAAKRHEQVDSCIVLDDPMSVDQLPGFWQGDVSVQDASAQLAASLLEIEADQHILDACAAPGGKSTHILELMPSNSLTAIDIDPKRLEKVQENLDRCQFKANLICADATDTKNWWDGQRFDRILLDAPCTGSGVIRRHPDIKYLRQAEEIKILNKIQLALLQSLWPLLKSGGLLLYATCSIFPEENCEVISSFLKQTPDAKEKIIRAPWGILQSHGRQILPDEKNMDGFYYACLQKNSLSCL